MKMLRILSAAVALLCLPAALAAAEPTYGQLKRAAQQQGESYFKNLTSDQVGALIQQAARFSPSLSSTEIRNILAGNKGSEVLEKLETANSILMDAASGEWGSAGYTAAKELIVHYVPALKYAFTTAETVHKSLEEVSKFVAENNVEFIRAEFVRNYLKDTDGTIPAPVRDRFIAHMDPYLAGGRGSVTYGLCRYICDNNMDTGKLAGVCVSGPFSWAKRYEFNGADQPERALRVFLATDVKLRGYVAQWGQIVASRQKIEETAQELRRVMSYVQKQVAAIGAENEARIAEIEQANEARDQVNRRRLTPSPPKRDAAEQAQRAHDQYMAYMQQYGEITTRMGQAKNAHYEAMGAKRRELGISGGFGTLEPFLVPPVEAEIDEEDVSANQSMAERLEKQVDNARKELEVQRIEAEWLARRISFLQEQRGPLASAQALAVQWSETYGSRYWGVGGDSVAQLDLSIEEATRDRERFAATLERAQANISAVSAIASQYRAAAKRGMAAAQKAVEEAEPERERYEAARQEYEEADREVRDFAAEALNEVDEVVQAIQRAETVEEVEALAPRLEREMGTYVDLVRRREAQRARANEAAARIHDTLNRREVTSAGSLIGLQSSDYAYRGMSPDRYSGMPGAFAITPHLDAIVRANRYVLDTANARLEEAQNLLDGMVGLPEAQFKERAGRIHQLSNTAPAIRDQAAKIAGMEQVVADLAGSRSQGSFAIVPVQQGKVEGLLSRDASAALFALSKFGDRSLRTLYDERRELIRQPTAFTVTRVGSQAGPFSGRILRLTSQDIEDGLIPFEITATGGGVVGAPGVEVSAGGRRATVEMETGTADDGTPMAVFTAMVPPGTGDRVVVDYQTVQGTLRSRNEFTLYLRDTTTGGEEQEIRAFYEKFARAYSDRDTLGVVGLLSLDWTADDDGSSVMDIEDMLENTFRVFDEITYTIAGVSVQRAGEDTFRVTYQSTVTGRIRDQNLTHEEKSRVVEVVGREDGKWRILRTEAGRYWR